MEESEERTTFEIALEAESLERIRRIVAVSKLNFRDVEDFLYAAILGFIRKKEAEIGRMQSVQVRRVDS